MRGAVGVYDIGICDDGEFTCSEIEEMLLQYEKNIWSNLLSIYGIRENSYAVT